MTGVAKAETIEGKQSPDQLPRGMAIYMRNMANIGRRVRDVLYPGDIPEHFLKGWIISSDVDVLSNINTVALLLQPGEVIWPWGDNFRAQKQMKAWEKEFDGPIIHLLVPDPEQKDTPWLAQPVLRDWLVGYAPDSLQILHDAAKTEQERLRYRAAIIARTGEKPKNLLKK